VQCHGPPITNSSPLGYGGEKQHDKQDNKRSQYSKGVEAWSRVRLETPRTVQSYPWINKLYSSVFVFFVSRLYEPLI
jgi:hypothetical protein